MAGPVTLVTGASGGIGGALAAMLAQQGHRLVLSGLDQSGLDALARTLPRRAPASRRWPAMSASAISPRPASISRSSASAGSIIS